MTPVQAAEAALRQAKATGRALPVGKLYASVNARLLAAGADRVVGYEELLAVLREHFIETDGGWALD